MPSLRQPGKPLKVRTTPEQLAVAYEAMNIRDDG
jgi:hypothetical protein